MKVFIAKQLLKIINWVLKVLFTEKEIEIQKQIFGKIANTVDSHDLSEMIRELCKSKIDVF